jgi:hypothetical protein
MVKLLVPAMLLASFVSASAADYSAVLFDLRGDPIVDELSPGPRDETGKVTHARWCSAAEYKANPKNCDVLTLGAAAGNALSVNDKDVEELSARERTAEKARRGNLARRLYHGGKIDLGAEDIALIKRMIGLVYGSVVTSAALPLLDPAGDPK